MLDTNEPLISADLEKKRRTKVFNWSEVHLYRVTSYKIHTLLEQLFDPRFFFFSGLKGAYAWAQKEANNGSSLQSRDREKDRRRSRFPVRLNDVLDTPQ